MNIININKLTRFLPGLMIVGTLLLISSCGGSDSGGDPPPPAPQFVGLVNVELKNVNLTDADRGIFQLYIDATLVTANSVPCVMNHPYESTNLSCGSGSYDAATKTMTIPMTVDGAAGETLTLVFNSTSNITANLSSGSNNYTGGAKLAEMGLVIRSEYRRDTAKYTTFTVTNPVPGYDRAVLSGPDGFSDIVLWDNNDAQVFDYIEHYNSFDQSDTNDGTPQNTVSIYSINTKNAANDTRVPAGTYTVTLSNPVSGTGTRMISTNYTKPDAQDLFVTNGLPVALVDFRFGQDQIAANNDASNPLTVTTSAPYTLTWTNSIDASLINTVKWQLTGSLADGASTFPHTQVRTLTRTNGSTGGPVYTGQNGLWTWTLPGDFVFNAGQVIAVNLRVYDANTTMLARSATFYITR